MSKTDFQNGFALGLSSGGVVEVIDTTEIDNLEDLIDNSGVLEDTEGSVSEKVEELIDKAQWENFWYEQSSEWTSCIQNMFAGATIIPRLNCEKMGQMRNIFAATQAERIDYYINSGKSQDCSRSFQSSKKMIFIYGIDTSNCASVVNMCDGCNLLETIQEPLNFQKVVSVNNASNVFKDCLVLKNVRFVKETIKVSISFAWSSLLSAESIQSIIDGLATVETAQTLTLNSAITLTDEQKATINAKGWTLAQ